MDDENKARSAELTKRIRELEVVSPADYASLTPYTASSGTTDYQRRLSLIHEVFFFRDIPSVVAEAADRHASSLQGLDEFCALVLLLEFGHQSILSQRKRQLLELGAEKEAVRIENRPANVERLIALRPWADGAGVLEKLERRWRANLVPSAPFRIPPLTISRVAPLIHWIVARWLHPADVLFDVERSIFPWKDWRDVMFLLAGDIPLGLEDKMIECSDRVRSIEEYYENR